MKNLNYLIVLLTLSSCQKDEKIKKAQVTVKYEVSWPGTSLDEHGNSISYSNAAGNSQSDNHISGSYWSKAVTIDPGEVTHLVLMPMINASNPGICHAKISIDGEVKSENHANSNVPGAVIFNYFTTAIYNFPK